MALLLAMYQKMRLIREKNQLTLNLTQYTSKLDRIQKNIERTNKRYTSLFAQLESQAKQMKNNFNLSIRDAFGLGANQVDPMNYSGINGFVYQIMSGMLQAGGYTYKDKDGNETPVQMTQQEVQEMMNEYMANGGKFLPKEDVNNPGKYIQGEYQKWSPAQVSAFMTAMRTAQMKQQQASINISTATGQYENNVSIWLEAQKAQLEAEQDAALDALSYEETMMELDKTQAEAKLQRLNAQIQTYDQLCSTEAQNSAPKFGLG